MPSSFNSKITISPEFNILKNFSLSSDISIFGLSFDDILYDDNICENLFLMRSRIIMKELEIYIKYFPSENNKDVK